MTKIVEVKPDPGENNEAVADEFPIGLADFKPDQVLFQIGFDVPTRKARLQGHAGPKVRVEMDVLNAADIGALVDKNADLQRAAKNVSDQVQLIPFGPQVNGLVRIRECHVQHL